MRNQLQIGSRIWHDSPSNMRNTDYKARGLTMTTAIHRMMGPRGSPGTHHDIIASRTSDMHACMHGRDEMHSIYSGRETSTISGE